MSTYQTVLNIAREQAAAASRGDLEEVIRLLNERGDNIVALPVATRADHATVAEILRLDRVVAGALRARMLAIRAEVTDVQRGAEALLGYAPPTPARTSVLDSRA